MALTLNSSIVLIVFIITNALLVGIKLPLSFRKNKIYDKKYKCLYCNGMQSKLARHLQRKHAEEEEVRLCI